MADDSQKTEQPSGRKLAQARSRGQVIQSREVNNLFMLATSAALVLLYAPTMVGNLRRTLARFLEPTRLLGAEGVLWDAIRQLMGEIAMSLVFPLVIMIAAALASTLADDYELGRRIANAGGKVLLLREAVWTMYPAQTLRGFWEHQVRWARTVRACRPMSYVGLLFTQGLPFALFGAILAPKVWMAVSYIVAYLALRFTMAWTVGVWGVGDAILRQKIWLVPLYDAVHFVTYLASFASNKITWAGDEFVIRNGEMAPIRNQE